MAIGFQNGYLHVGRLAGAPIRLHWSIPIGALVLGRFRFVPWFWVSFLVLVLVHEAGHALMVRAARARVVSIDAHGAGGVCHWEGSVSDIWRALIAWGGVVAQAVLLVGAYVCLAAFGPPHTEMSAGMADAFTDGNLWLMAVNLIPIPGFDGATAWPLFPALLRRWRARRAKKREQARAMARARAQLAAQDEIAKQVENVESAPNPEVDEMVERLFEKTTRKK
jgi:hypothetical protein